MSSMKILLIIIISIIVTLTNACTNNAIFNLNNDIYKTRLQINSENDSIYVIKANSKIKGKLESNVFKENSTFISNSGDSIPLDFHIIKPYFTGAYQYSIKNYDFLIFENSIPGASGLSANITEVTLISFINSKHTNKLSFSSFVGGASLLKFENNTFHLSIFNYSGKDKNLNDIYCRTDFLLKDREFKRDTETQSLHYILKDEKIVQSQSKIGCNTLNLPFVQ